MIESKSEIIEGLEQNFQNLINFINKQGKTSFEDKPDGKWSAGQQIDHLIKSVKPFNLVLAIPKFIYPLVWGKMNRKGRNYEELLTRYNEKLSNGGTASSPFIPLNISFDQKEDKIKIYNLELKKLINNLNNLSEKQLDTLILPHPLLGKLSLREMMFFTIFHTAHHLNILENRN